MPSLQSILRGPFGFLLTLLTFVGCPIIPQDILRPEDALEPNDDAASATLLLPGVAVSGVAIQSNLDVFAVDVEAGKTLVFTFASTESDSCANFAISAPDGQTLYDDGDFLCGRNQPKIQASTVQFSQSAGALTLRVSPTQSGRYLIAIDERPFADNVFPNLWRYELTATVE